MVFSSVPAYFDPSNWQPQQINHQIIGSAPHPAPAPPPVGPGSGSGQTRPGSMTERARLANIPIPEAALKCPRCESTNTKFCYFNNYSLTQPRHFCKTCRRYWTRGGALRTVPVGGGCRRNKRTKSSSAASKSSSSGGGSRQSPTANPGQTGGGGPTGFAGNLLNLTAQFQPPLRFPAPLSGQLDSGLDLGPSGFAGYQGPTSLMGSIEPWRLQQFPFLGSLDTSFVGGGGELGFLGESRANAFAAVKMEEQNPNLSLSRELLLGGIQANEHAWNLGSGANWAELSSFSSSSTSNHLQ